MKIEWTIYAVSDRETIFDYIESGRPGRVEGTRELVIEHTPFIVAYRIAQRSVRILRVLNGAQQWPNAMPEDKDL